MDSIITVTTGSGKAGSYLMTSLPKKAESVYKPEALKSLYRSPGYKKNQLVLCPAVVVILELRSS
jgi:hypothetical protein